MDVHWEVISQIMAIRDHVASQTTITINGDTPDRQKGLELVEQYGVNGIMIGRRIFKDLYAFEKEPKTHTPQELLGLLCLQLDLQDKCAELMPRSTVGLHRSFKVYVRGLPGVSDLRAQLMNTKSADEVRQLLVTFEAEHSVLD